MSSTVFFNLVTLPYSTTNDVEVRLYKTSSPNAAVATQSKPAPHPQTTWSFPGLDRTNYIVRIFDMAGIPFQIGEDFTVIPDNDTTIFFEPFWIQFDVTLNPDDGVPFASGTNTFTVTSWIGRDIIFDRKGADTQDETDITWDRNTGIALLQQPGDQFQPNEKWFLEFLPLTNNSSSVGNGTFGRLWSERKYVTADTVLTDSDIAKKIMIKGGVSYLEVTLPDASLVSEDTVTWIESCRISHDCVLIKCFGSNLIDWLGSARNGIYMIPNESLEIWIEVVSGTPKWRIQAAEGNFYNVGKFVSDYGGAGLLVPNLIANGQEVAVKAFARLYFEFVKKLSSPGQVCNYADWSTGVNKYKFSLSSNVGSEIDGTFRVPDLDDLFERNSGSVYGAAYWEDFQMEDHMHYVPLGSLPSGTFGTKSSTNYNVGQYNGLTNAGADRTSQAYNLGGALAKIGSETRPTNYRVVKRILI